MFNIFKSKDNKYKNTPRINYSKRNDSGNYYIKIGHKGKPTFNAELIVSRKTEVKLSDLMKISVGTMEVDYTGEVEISVSEMWLFDKKNNTMVAYSLFPYTAIICPGDAVVVDFIREIRVEN